MPNAQKVEITVPIDETELLRLLLARYDEGQLRRAGILPEASVIRSMSIEPDGKVNFRVTAVSITDPASLLEEIHAEELAARTEVTQNEEEPLTINYEPPDPTEVEESQENQASTDAPSCPAAERTLVRIRKSRKASNSRRTASVVEDEPSREPNPGEPQPGARP